jgi:hypothetical protein
MINKKMAFLLSNGFHLVTLLKKFRSTKKGSGTVEFETSSLSAGNYFYTLYADSVLAGSIRFTAK